MKFKVGDRVKVVSVSKLNKVTNGHIRIGMTGTVKVTGEKIIGVEFDKYMGGHDGNSRLWRGKFGHCLNVLYGYLEKIEESKEEVKKHGN